MNRKLLKFILSGALLFGCVGMFSSCKDTNEDQFAILESEDVNLQNQLNQATAKANQLESEIGELRGLINSHLANHPSGCTCDLSSLDSRLAAIEATLTASNIAQAGNVAAQLVSLESTLAEVQKQLDNLEVKDYPGLEELLKIADVDNLKRVLDGYEYATLPEALEDLIKKVADLESQTIPEDLTERVEGIEEQVKGLQEELGLKANQEDLDKAIQEINQAIADKAAELQGKVDSLVEQLAEKANQADLDALTTSVKELKDALTEGLADLQDQIDAINEVLNGLDSVYAKIEDLKTIEDRLNSIINSIVIQQVTNKVFGSLMLPLDIQTNILMAYHGYNASGIKEFPSVRTACEYNAGKGFTSAELADVDRIAISQVLLDESENNAGNVYFTVNPSNVNLKNSVFSLVNSLDQSCGIQLSQPVPSDKLLLYGWSRANNGFYWSNAYLSEADINKCSIGLGEELKKEVATTAKEFLHDLRHMDRPDISQIAATIKNVLQRFNGKLTANAIKGEYQYKDLAGNTVKASTYSNYGIAALTFEPQSFCFLEGQDNKFDKLPTIPTIGDFEFEMNEIKFDFNKKIDIKDIDLNIQFEGITFNPEDLTFTGYIEVDGVKYYIQDATVDGLDKIAQTINDKLEEVIGLVSDDVTAQVNDMVADIQAQIEKMLDDMSAEVNDQLNDLMSDLSDEVNDQLGKYTDRINRLINKVNKLIARVNRVLANPNRYLQPIAIYSANGGQDLHVLSTSKVAPSKFYLNGGNATTLYFTSYTLETIAPAYKKYVKVVNAWKNGDASRATVASAVNNANSKGNLNEVINGNQIRFAFAPEAGYTYEIVFQAVDYQGYTSTRRCFIEVR